MTLVARRNFNSKPIVISPSERLNESVLINSDGILGTSPKLKKSPKARIANNIPMINTGMDKLVNAKRGRSLANKNSCEITIFIPSL